MNVANLQLEGLVMAVAALTDTLVRKGALSADEVDLALARVETALASEDRSYEDLSPSNRDAVCFPVRLLRLANSRSREGRILPFSELAKAVGRTKQSYNDQM